MYAFELTRAKTVADAAATLAKSGGKPLAGGQSLVGAMKLRLAQPGTLVDLSGIAELKGIQKDGDAVVIGAMTRHAEISESSAVRSAIPAKSTCLRCRAASAWLAARTSWSSWTKLSTMKSPSAPTGRLMKKIHDQ